MDKCDHIIGINEYSVTNTKTEKIISVWREEVTASIVELSDYLVTTTLTPPNETTYKYCPLCGIDISGIKWGHGSWLASKQDAKQQRE